MPCARSSARSRRSFCRRWRWPARGPTTPPSSSTPVAGRSAGCTRLAAWLHPPRAPRACCCSTRAPPSAPRPSRRWRWSSSCVAQVCVCCCSRRTSRRAASARALRALSPRPSCSAGPRPASTCSARTCAASSAPASSPSRLYGYRAARLVSGRRGVPSSARRPGEAAATLLAVLDARWPGRARRRHLRRPWPACTICDRPPAVAQVRRSEPAQSSWRGAQPALARPSQQGTGHWCPCQVLAAFGGINYWEASMEERKQTPQRRTGRRLPRRQRRVPAEVVQRWARARLPNARAASAATRSTTSTSSCSSMREHGRSTPCPGSAVAPACRRLGEHGQEERIERLV